MPRKSKDVLKDEAKEAADEQLRKEEGEQQAGDRPAGPKSEAKATPPEVIAARRKKDPTAPKVKRYEVTNAGRVMNRGQPVAMKPGKIVDTLNYDVPTLQKQGLQMRELED